MDRRRVGAEEAKNGIDISLGLVWAHLESNDRHRTGEVEANNEPPPWVVVEWGSVSQDATISDRMGLAALCLHGQPGGFTEQDVDDLNGVLRLAEEANNLLTPVLSAHRGNETLILRVCGVRDKIQALLVEQGSTVVAPRLAGSGGSSGS